MKRFDKQAVISSIDLFEKKQEQGIKESDALPLLLDILTPLLETEGYTVTNEAQLDKFQYIDFLGVRGKEKIGIEYKHYKNGPAGSKEAKEFVHRANIVSLDKIIFLCNTGFNNAAKEIANRIDPLAFELLDIDGLKSWVSRIEANYEEDEIVQIVRSYVSRLIALIAKSSEVLTEIEWRDIERVVAEVFSGLGFDAILTPSSKDGGKDVILECTERGTKRSYIVEIKHWRSGQRVGEGKIREFLQVITREKRDGGLFLSTYGFVENAVESLTQIDREKVKFGEETKIATLCKTYIKKKSGLWQNEDELPVILFEDTV